MTLTYIQKSIIQFVVVCCFFYVEAIIHFNIGKTGKLSFAIPDCRENIKIFCIIVFFAGLSSFVTYIIETYAFG